MKKTYVSSCFKINANRVIVYLALLLVAGCQSKKMGKLAIEEPMFTLLSEDETNITFKNTIVDTAELTLFDSDLIYSGAGIAAGDINNDGLVDLFFVSNQNQHELYLNKGNFKFENITPLSNLKTKKGWPAGVTMADVNGDGWLDIYISFSGFKQEEDKRNQLWINNKDLTFTEMAAQYGINDNGASSMSNFFDYDNDGDLDLFVVNYPDDITNTFELPFYLNPNLIDTINCNQLYENIGDSFINVTTSSGIGYKNADGFNVSIADINQDGFVDLYVNVDLLQPDFFYINNGDKTFTESLNSYFNIVPMFSMGSTFSDFNNDGLMDLITSEMMPPEHARRKNNMPHPDVDFYEHVLKGKFNSNQHSRNMLQIQNQDGTFSEVGELANISRTDWSWATLSIDLNNDEHKDLFISNGVKRDVFDQTYLALSFEEDEIHSKKYSHDKKDLIKNYPIFLPTNYIYQNNGDLTFTDKREEWGFMQKAASQGAVYADLNNDGFPELIVSNSDSTAFLYKNNGATLTDNNYLKTSFEGAGKNKFGIGAKVWIYYNGKSQYQQLTNAQGWQSSSEPTMFWGLSNHDEIDSLRVVWVSGNTQTIPSIKANQHLILNESDAVKNLKNTQPTNFNTLFTKLKAEEKPQFKHVESDFIDYRRDKMIPKKMSREGPGMAIGDINNDGTEDFYIGGAAGQSAVLFIQDQKGNFIPLKNQPWEKDDKYEDMGIAFFDLNKDGFDDIYVVSGSNEFNFSDSFLKDRIYINNGNNTFSKADENVLKIPPTSGSIVKVIDLNADGADDLIIGGRVLNQNYPLAPESFILINENGVLVNKTDQWCPELKKIGMVTDIKLADINNDGHSDLIIAGEWMPITLFLRKGDSFVNATKQYGLANTNGWWNSIVVGDFDNNGFLDIIGGNYGTNSVLKGSVEEPVVCYMNDFDKNGFLEPIVCYYKEGILAPYADRDLITRTVPSISNQFLTYKSYSKASINDVFTKEQLKTSTVFYAYELRSSLFLNNGKTFDKSYLPNEIQVAPTFGMSVFDYNNDGNLDLFVAGNSYSSFYEEGPMAAQRSITLQGDGKGNFKPLLANQTGVSINKDMKSTGLIFVKAKGTYLQLIGCNNAELEVFEISQNIRISDDIRRLGSGYLFNYSPNKGNYQSYSKN
jgi:hypothetical protein